MIRAVFRVQCDGPGKEWLSVPPHLIGRDILPEALTVEPTAERAGNWPGEGAARRAAIGAGWSFVTVNGSWKLMCPPCALNPLGIVLPKSEPTCPECAHWTRIHNAAGCWAPDCDCERDS